MSKHEIPVSNGPDKADLLRAVTNPDAHLHVTFRTPTEVVEAHVDFVEEIAEDDGRLALLLLEHRAAVEIPAEDEDGSLGLLARASEKAKVAVGIDDEGDPVGLRRGAAVLAGLEQRFGHEPFDRLAQLGVHVPQPVDHRPQHRHGERGL